MVGPGGKDGIGSTTVWSNTWPGWVMLCASMLSSGIEGKAQFLKLILLIIEWSYIVSWTPVLSIVNSLVSPEDCKVQQLYHKN